MNAEDLDRLIGETIVDAYGDDEQLWAFHSALEDGIELPCNAFVTGELVSVVKFDYDGNQRRGLVAGQLSRSCLRLPRFWVAIRINNDRAGRDQP